MMFAKALRRARMQIWDFSVSVQRLLFALFVGRCVVVAVNAGTVPSRCKLFIRNSSTGTKIELDCYSSSNEQYFMNFSKVAVNPMTEEFIVGGNNLLLRLNRNFGLLEVIEKKNESAKAACISRCMQCTQNTDRRFPSAEKPCSTGQKGTCPDILGARCTDWYTNIEDGGFHADGSRLVVTCNSNYFDQQCQFRRADNLSNVVYEMAVNQTADNFKRSPIFHLYNSSTVSVLQNGSLAQPYYTAGYIYYAQHSSYQYLRYSYHYSHMIQRRNSATLGLEDLYQDGDDVHRTNPTITPYVEYVHQFEYKETIHIVARDYGKPPGDAYSLYDEIGQPYVMSFCKMDGGIRPSGSDRNVFTTLVRIILQCQSQQRGIKAPPPIKFAVFNYKRITGATVVTIKGEKFLFGVFNTFKGEPLGAAMCAYQLDTLNSHLKTLREINAADSCNVGRADGIQCSKKPTKTNVTPRDLRAFGTALLPVKQNVLSSGNREASTPLWRRDGIELNQLTSMSINKTAYLFTSYNDHSLAVFGVDIQNPGTTVQLINIVQVTRPNVPFDTILSLTAAPFAEAVLISTNYQVIKFDAKPCLAHLSSCGVCTDNTDYFDDANCRLCKYHKPCILAKKCPVSTAQPCGDGLGSYVPAAIREAPMDQRSTVGSKVTMKCVGEGTGQLEMKWINQITGMPVTPSGSRVQIFRNGSTLFLEFSPLQADDGGLYTCSVSDELVAKVGTAKLSVVPHFSVQPQDVLLPLGHCQSLHCKAEGFPSPSTSWIKDGVQITDDNVNSFGLVRTASGGLLIKDSRLFQAGRYYCQAVSLVDIVNSSVAIVTVLNTTVAPSQNIEAKIGESIELKCMSQPTGAVYQWYKDNNPLADGDSSTYVISNISLDHTETYMCTYVVSNLKHIAGRFVLRVLRPPQFHLRPKSVSVVVGKTASLECIPDAAIYPPAVTSWEYRENPNSAHTALSDDYLLAKKFALSDDKHHLQMFGIDPERAGFYYCSLTNSQGTITSFAKLDVQIPPQISTCQEDLLITNPAGPVQLSCVFRGTGKEKRVVFTHDNQPLPGEPKAVYTNNGYYKAVLDVEEPQIGTYSCQAIIDSVTDTSNCSWVLWTKSKPPIVSTPAPVSKSSSNVSTAVVIGVCIAVAVASLIIGLLIGSRFPRRDSDTASRSDDSLPSEPDGPAPLKFHRPPSTHTALTTLTTPTGTGRSNFNSSPPTSTIYEQGNGTIPGSPKSPLSACGENGYRNTPPPPLQRSESKLSRV